MSLADMLTQRVVVVRRAYDAMDEFGDAQPGTEVRTTYPARLEALSSEELVRDRDTVVADWRAFLPAGADVKFHDVLEAEGIVFEVQGDPLRQRAPRGVHHVEVKLRRTT